MRNSLLLLLAIVGIACAGENRVASVATLSLHKRRYSNSVHGHIGSPEFYRG